MPFKSRLSELVNIDKSELPSSYQKIGDIILIKLMKVNKNKALIAEAIHKLFPYIKTICEIKEIKGEFREPKIEKLWGNGTETIHKEHEIQYKLDVSRIMFSKGNHFERKRLLEEIKPDEAILDMFAGIGYFSLAIAKKARHIYAIEKNPTAFSYLKENIKLNKITNITPINDDCRNIEIPERADRIIMGYIPHTEKFLNTALNSVKPGTIVHFHNTYLETELWKNIISEIDKACKQAGFSYRIMKKRKVKSVGPRIYHVVVDFEVK